MFRQKYTKDGNLFSPAMESFTKNSFCKYSELLHLTTFKQHLITQYIHIVFKSKVFMNT